MSGVIRWLFVGLCASWVGILGSVAQAQDGETNPAPQSVYVFGNSLVHHLTDTDETTVPHWMAKLANAAGTELWLDGQWGFLRDFAKSGTPSAGWSFKNVKRGWSRDIRNFADVSWDTVMITPANFIQYQGADKAFDGDNPDKASPLSATLQVIDNIEGAIGPVRFAIYEGWADMGSYTRSFPPNARQMRKYQQFNSGDYHDWFEAYVAMLRSARPEARIDLVPVASVLAELIEGGVLDGLDAKFFYKAKQRLLVAY